MQGKNSPEFSCPPCASVGKTVNHTRLASGFTLTDAICELVAAFPGMFDHDLAKRLAGALLAGSGVVAFLVTLKWLGLLTQ